jgi:hypothetical protein
MKISCLSLAFLLLGLLGLPARPLAGPGPMGARAGGLAGAALPLADVWAISNNPAGIAALKRPALGAYAENRFHLKAFMTVSCQGVWPLRPGTGLGLELSRFGDRLYNEQQVGLGLGHQLGPVRLGLKASVWQVHLEGLGSKRVVALSFGGQSEVIPHLTFAAYLFNLNQARLAAYQQERLPTRMAAALAYQPSGKLLLTLQAEKEIALPAELTGGLEYVVLDKLALRAGAQPGRRALTGGVGWKAKALQIDYALGGHAALGLRNQVSVAYQWP